MSVNAGKTIYPVPLRPSQLSGLRRGSNQSASTERSELWQEDTWSNSMASQGDPAASPYAAPCLSSPTLRSLSAKDTKSAPFAVATARRLWPQATQSSIIRAIGEAQLFRLFGNASHAQQKVTRVVARWSSEETARVCSESDRLLSQSANLLHRTMMLGHVACLYAQYDALQAKSLCDLVYEHCQGVESDTERALVLMAITAMPEDRRLDHDAIKTIVGRSLQQANLLHILTLRMKTPSANNEQLVKKERELVKRVATVARRAAVHPAFLVCSKKNDHAASPARGAPVAGLQMRRNATNVSICPADGADMTNFLGDDFVLL